MNDFANVPLVHETEIVEDARKELLCRLAWLRDHIARLAPGGRKDLPPGAPLLASAWEASARDIELAATEAAKLGEVCLTTGWGAPRVTITEKGYERARRYGYSPGAGATPADLRLFEKAVRAWRQARAWGEP